MRKILPLFLVVSAACLRPQDVTLAPPASGFQMGSGIFPVPKAGALLSDGGVFSGETQRCYFFDVPSDAPVWVNRFEIAQNTGTHHMNIFRVKTVIGLGGDAGDVVADGP